MANLPHFIVDENGAAVANEQFMQLLLGAYERRKIQMLKELKAVDGIGKRESKLKAHQAALMEVAIVAMLTNYQSIKKRKEGEKNVDKKQ